MQKFNKSKLLPLALGVALTTPLIAYSSTTYADTSYKHYVSDTLHAPLRRGAGNEFRIMRMLSSGSPVKLLKSEGNWVRVEYNHNGSIEIGWMDKIAVQNQPPASMLLEEEKKRYARLETRFKSMEEEFKELKTQANDSLKTSQNLNQENFELNKELEHIKNISSKAIALDAEAQEMRKDLKTLESENLVMKQQLSQAEDTVKRQWFLTGAGVLLFGLILGRFFRMPKKRGSWDKI